MINENCFNKSIVWSWDAVSSFPSRPWTESLDISTCPELRHMSPPEGRNLSFWVDLSFQINNAYQFWIYCFPLFGMRNISVATKLDPGKVIENCLDNMISEKYGIPRALITSRCETASLPGRVNVFILARTYCLKFLWSWVTNEIFFASPVLLLWCMKFHHHCLNRLPSIHAPSPRSLPFVSTDSSFRWDGKTGRHDFLILY